ncbi:glycosyltransferase family 4 protein [Pluralibacter gergoviae]|uniref:glycosyltransferase family 4 protein n=1 Tax=Pluralibacter gergoviae TaxID=61647 RepID=UPI003310EA01|nr:glycosyltransferase family 4 protein [Pluralibacter gergoviae]
MIYVNGRFLTQDITGVQRFSFEIVKELLNIRSDIVIIVPEEIVKYNFPLVSDLNVKVVKGGAGHFWEQTTLPLYLKKIGSPLLLNLCNTAPAFYKNQIVTHHDVTYAKYPENFSFSFRIFYSLVPRLFLRNSKKIITVSEFSKKEITQHYKLNKHKLNVIYNAVNNDFVRLSPSVDNDENKNKKYFLAVSSLAHHKNLHGLIQEFSLIPSHYNINLIIVGGGSSHFVVNNREIKAGNINFKGRVTDEELRVLYKNALAFVFPSLYEGFGIPPLEAQACGCPVISSNCSVMPEVLRDSVIYFDPQTKNDLCSKMISFIQNPQIIPELISKGFENHKRFSWHESALKLNDIIDGCL